MTASVGTEQPKALVRALDGRRGTVVVLAVALTAAALAFALAFGLDGIRGAAATGRAIAVSVVVGVVAAILAFWLRAAITAPAADDKRDGTAEGGAFRVTGRARPPTSEPGLARRATEAVAALGGAEIAVSGHAAPGASGSAASRPSRPSTMSAGWTRSSARSPRPSAFCWPIRTTPTTTASSGTAFCCTVSPVSARPSSRARAPASTA